MTPLWFFSALAFVLLLPGSAASQSEPRRLTLEEAIRVALENYPQLAAARAEARAARAGVDLARTAYLPRTDLLWQENRATRNNVFGLLLPQSVIPPISGPVLGTSALEQTAWGSAGGMLVQWEPFDFGTRRANVDAARASERRASARVELTRLEVASAAAEAFLGTLTAEEAVRATRATVDRMQAFARVVQTLAANDLRPGAEASRAQAELAVARNQLISAEASVESGRATLAEALGLAGESVAPNPGALLELPPAAPAPAAGLEAHPLVEAAAAQLDAARARERALDRSYFPRFNYQFALYGRGSGALLDGRIDPSKGLLPDVPNWATGLQITFPTLDIFAIRARRRAESSAAAAEAARYEAVVQQLRAANARAATAAHAARRIAANTPEQLSAARDTERLARARYDAGLTSVLEVAEAERLLASAEVEDAVARLNAWRALLGEVRARGVLEPYLEVVRRSVK